ncbi:MAG: hypothetical protein AO394_02935 [Candidatus Fermentibacter daniensis]|nr:MAG: hypothetical protein AO394_02935 [Candidatus Fermentibacter daniensis]
MARDLPVFRAVDRQVGIQEVESGAAHADHPDRGRNVAPVQGQGNHHRPAVVIKDGADRCVRVVVDEIPLLLPAVAVEVLTEVALPVEERYSNQRQAEFAGALERITREHAQPAGVDRQALVQAELHGEEGCQKSVDAARPAFHRLVEPCRPPQVVLETARHLVQVGEVDAVRGEFLEALLIDPAEQQYRVVEGLLPQVAVNRSEEIDCIGVPCPPEVVGYVLQRGQALWYPRHDLVQSGLHGPILSENDGTEKPEDAR